ncbi:MAG: hypothetical protein COA42_02340 [Alteromonadaceae bacterium]|nr:MAG: hypothetical protein COA42_02340 [Alteromonadaceae bacterium]
MIKCVYATLLLLLLCQCTPDGKGIDVNASTADNNSIQGTIGTAGITKDASTSNATLTITDAFVKPTFPGQKKVIAYLAIHNPSGTQHTLSHVHCNLAGHVQIEREYYEHGALNVKPVEQLIIDPNSKLQFKPRGYRLVLSGLVRELKAEESFEIIFEFERGLSINATVKVKPFG